MVDHFSNFTPRVILKSYKSVTSSIYLELGFKYFSAIKSYEILLKVFHKVY